MVNKMLSLIQASLWLVLLLSGPRVEGRLLQIKEDNWDQLLRGVGG